MAPKLREPLRDQIGRVLYEEPVTDPDKREWHTLSEDRREPWRADADRIVNLLKDMRDQFEQFAMHIGGVDWLAIGPGELWDEFLGAAEIGDPASQLARENRRRADFG